MNNDATREWSALLWRQAEEREALHRNHEEEREMVYRRLKAALDAANSEWLKSRGPNVTGETR